MKKLFLLLSIGLLIISCSSEENEIAENQTSKLIELEQRQFQNGILTEKIISKYNNNKLTLTSFYDENNQLTHTFEWNYSNNNYLSSIRGYLSNGTLISETNITYDSSNRITQTVRSERNGTYLITTNFTHNSDNTINSYTNSSGNTSTKTFEVNNNGIIDKEIINGDVRVSVEYNNLSPITSTLFSSTYNYTYQENGSLPFSFANIVGTIRINAVLFQNSLADSITSLTTELVTGITSGSSSEEYIYTLNEDNFPLTKKDYYNGELTNEFDYTYE
jgi:hypothetical protein